MLYQDIKNLQWLMAELKLRDTLPGIATAMLQQLVNSDQLKLYCDEELTGVPEGTELEEILSTPCGPDDEIYIEKLMVSSEPPHHITGRKQLQSIYITEVNGKEVIGVGRFIANGQTYFSTDEGAIFVESAEISPDQVYCLGPEVQLAKKLLQAPSSAPPPEASRPYSRTVGSERGLALLAREKADKTSSFRIGSKVNASKFKEHILSLAQRYEVSDHGLRKLDDTINRVLNKEGLNEVTPR